LDLTSDEVFIYDWFPDKFQDDYEEIEGVDYSVNKIKRTTTTV